MGFRRAVKRVFTFRASKAVDPPVPKEKELTPNEQVVAEFVKRSNQREDVRCLFDDRVDILFQEAPMTLDGYLEEWEKVFKSFPDFYLRAKGGINEKSDGKVVAELIVGGTHTGVPYGFGPFPEVEATNVKVINDPEGCTFTVKDGKITRFFIEPVGGELTGPPGIYKQIGGLIF